MKLKTLKKLTKETPYAKIYSFKLEDKAKKRFTDAILYAKIGRKGKITLLLQHEKGYPSEKKGKREKIMQLNWIPENPPIV